MLQVGQRVTAALLPTYCAPFASRTPESGLPAGSAGGDTAPTTPAAFASHSTVPHSPGVTGKEPAELTAG